MIYPLSPMAQERIQDEATRSDFIYRVNLGRADDVRLMIRQGSSANQLSGEGVPVLSLAAARTDEESVNVMYALLDNGANINARDRNGQTALFHAAKVGNVAGINFLLAQGIDMYAIDNSGNVARSVAHLQGQEDALKAIDDYVLRQTEEITKSYAKRGGKKKKGAWTADLEKAMGMQPSSGEDDASDEEEVAADEESATDEESAADEVDETDVQAAPGMGVLSAAAPKKKLYKTKRQARQAMMKSIKKTEVLSTNAPAVELDEEDKKDAPKIAGALHTKKSGAARAVESSEPFDPEDPDGDGITLKEELKDTIYEMAFNVCAFQYWYYCSSAGQSTDIDDEELIVAIESRKNSAEKLQATLIKDFHMKSTEVGVIAKTVQARIYMELDTMASNRDRHEKGVGKDDDMIKRCELQARHWGAQIPMKKKKAVKTKGGSRGAKGARSGGAARATGINGMDASIETMDPETRAQLMKKMKSKGKGGKKRGGKKH